jgi:hypothetical protein
LTYDPSDTLAEIAAGLRRYVAENPEAKDSADGIQRWWPVAGLRETSLPRIVNALESLVDEGTMRRVTQEDGRVIYSKASPKNARS